MKPTFDQLLIELDKANAYIATLEAQVAGMREVVQMMANVPKGQMWVPGVYSEKAQAILSSTPPQEGQMVMVRQEDLQKAVDLFGQMHNEWIQRLRKAALKE